MNDNDESEESFELFNICQYIDSDEKRHLQIFTKQSVEQGVVQGHFLRETTLVTMGSRNLFSRAAYALVTYI